MTFNGKHETLAKNQNTKESDENAMKMRGTDYAWWDPTEVEGDVAAGRFARSIDCIANICDG